MVPLEFCTVPRGQFMRKEIPDDKVRDILEFSTKKPHERLKCIKDGLQVRCLIDIRSRIPPYYFCRRSVPSIWPI